MLTFFLYPISLIPLRILYFFSDLCSYLLYYIFRYRREVVRENIHKSFPNLTDIEKITVEKNFYHFFCDNFIETIKLLSISEKEIQSRIKYDYTELENVLKKNQNCHIYVGHQFNWEWANAHFASMVKNIDVAVVYKPLKSGSANNLMLTIRGRFGSKMVAAKHMKREMNFLLEKQHILILAADQNPKIPEKSFWTSFLTQRTSFLSGTELHTAHRKTPSLFANIIREERGRYKFVLEPLYDFSAPYHTGIITKIFTEKLENAIVSNPENYLWSHKRWKHIYKNEYKKRWLNKSIGALINI